MKTWVVLALVLGSSVSFAADKTCRLSSVEAQILQENKGRTRGYPDVDYVGAKFAIYSARIDNRGGEYQVEAVFSTDDCKLLKSTVVWSD